MRQSDFDYGNARLRARRSTLLTDADYEHLIGEDIDDLAGALEETGYAPDLDAARRSDGLRRLHLTIRAHLGRSLEEMRSFYTGHARDLVNALLSRFDVQNVITVLRARSRPDPTTEDALTALTPVGWLVEPLAREVLRAQELAAVVDLLARRAPDPRQGALLRAAFSEYERTGDLAALERAVVGDHAARVAGMLRTPGPGGVTLLRFVQRETDEHNLLVVLRLRDAIASGAAGTPHPPDTLLPGGSIPLAPLAAAVQAPTAAAIVAALGRFGGGSWQFALERWARTGDLGALQRALERRAITDATDLFVSGDPLTIDVPLAFMTAKRVEARNLRLLGEAAVRGIPPEVVRYELVRPGHPA